MFLSANGLVGKMINAKTSNNSKTAVQVAIAKPASPSPSKPTPVSQGVQVSISRPTAKELEQKAKEAATALAYSIAKGNQLTATKAQTTLTNLSNVSKSSTSSQKVLLAVQLDGGSGGYSKPAPTTPSKSTGGNMPHIDPTVKDSTHANPHNGSITTTSGNSTVSQVVVAPKPNSVNVDEYNKQVEQAKLDYKIASYTGDKAKMLDAQNRSNYYRDMGATLQSGVDTAATKQLSSYFENNELVKRALKEGTTDAINAAMHQLINDTTWAQNNNDPAGAKAAEAVAKHLSSLGGTISSNATLQQSKQVITAQQKPAPTPAPAPANNSSDKKINSLILDFIPGVGNVKGGLEAATGKDSVTNEPLSTLERFIAGGGLFVGGFAKVIGKGVKVVTKSDDIVKTVTNVTSDMIRNVGNDFLDQMEAAGGHLLKKHVAQTNEDLIKRAMQEGVSVSTFTNKSTATIAVQENLQANADEIVKWLNSTDGRLLTKAFTAKHNHSIGRGVEEGSKHVKYNLDESKIILKKDPSQKLGFIILTGHPIVD